MRGHTAFEGRRWGLRSRRGPSTSPIVGTYVYLPGTTYRLGIHGVPLGGLVQVRRVFRGTSAEPPPPRPTPPSGRRSLPGPSPSKRRRTAPAPLQQGDRLDHERRPLTGHLYGDAGVVDPGDLERAFEPEVALGARDPRRSLRRTCAVDRGVDDDMMLCRTRCCWVKWCSKYPFNDFHHK